MSRLPSLLVGDRLRDAVLVPLIGVGQAAALGVAAFATRDAFAALHSGGAAAPATLAALAAGGIGAGVLELVSRQRAEALGQSYASDIRRILYAHLAGLTRRDLDGLRTGGLALRFVGDLGAARAWYGRGLPRLWSAAVVLPGAAIVLWLLHPALAVAAAVCLGLSLLAMVVMGLGLEARHRRLRSRRAGIAVAMIERLAISPELDLLARTDRELARLDSAGAGLRRDAVARATRAGVLRLMPHGGAALAGVAILWLGGARAIPPGTIAAALSVIGILLVPLNDLAQVWDRYCAWRVARGHLLRLLARPAARRQPVAAGLPVTVGIAATIDGREHRATIPGGGVALVTGPRGSGKSWLGRLIVGLERAGAGAVLYDGEAGRLPRAAHIGDVPVVVQGSLRRTLTLGIEPRPPRAAVAAVARAFGLAELMARIGGLRGRVGASARSASAGEALRIELARAVLAQPDLVVIDTARFWADPDRDGLLARLRAETRCTLVLVGAGEIAVPFDCVIDLTPARRAA